MESQVIINAHGIVVCDYQLPVQWERNQIF